MIYAVIVAALCVASQAVPLDLRFSSVDPAFEQAWTLFKAAHGKTYVSVEEEYIRQKIFGENLKKIESHNYLYDMGLKSYKMGVNRFTDMENSEVKKLNGLRMSDKKINGINHLPLNNVVIPKAVDWRQKGYVTPVKDQGQCGSCWAFSSTGSMEGQHFRKTGKLVSLSEQNLMDCSTSFGNEGCSGGLMDQAFAFVKANGGIDTEDSYPYTEQDSPNCLFTKNNVGATISGFVDIQPGNETMLAEAIATIGPVSVGIDASKASFNDYSAGIYEEDTCSSVNLDHGVLVVGYGSENGKDYWIVKNSWGSDWGENGYIRMARNKNNMCGIATSASYPLV